MSYVAPLNLPTRLDGRRIHKTFLLTLVALIAFAGCAAPIRLSTISLGGEPTITSTKHATIFLVPDSAVYLNSEPIAFGYQSQSEFIHLLSVELLRLKIFRTVSIDGNGQDADIRITLVFNRATYTEADWMAKGYLLDATMTIEDGKAMFLERYKIQSNEGLSNWQKMNINLFESKARGAQLLLEKLVHDIRVFIGENK